MNANHFVALLTLADATHEEKQEFFLERFDVRVPRASYRRMWERLVERLGLDTAARAVLELVLDRAKPRLLAVLREAALGQSVSLRQSDPRSVDYLFFKNGRPRKAGELLLDLFRDRESRGTPRRLNGRSEGEAQEQAGLTSHVLVTQLARKSIEGTLASAPPNTGIQFQQVAVSNEHHVKVPAGWSEAKLEEYICAEWQRIDFGLNEKVHLFGRQVRPAPEKTDKVDILAKTSSGRWVCIELKIDDADLRGLGQLLSYMQQLIVSLQVPKEDVVGLLIAPDFSDKVLNAAQRDNHVRLLQYVRRE